MSEDKQGEKLNKVVLDKADVENIREYANYYEAELPKDLDMAIDQFLADATFESQQGVKLALCKWIIESDNKSFIDDMWKTPKEASKKIVFDMQFDKDVNDTLTVEDPKE
jgi:hypothetical protein